MGNSYRVSMTILNAGFIALALLTLSTPFAYAQVGLGDSSSSFGRTVHVHPTGSPTANATALNAALGSTTVTGRSDPATQPVVIQLGPGVFEYAPGGSADAILMPENVSLVGAGRESTTITCYDACVVIRVSATRNQFRHLTVGSAASESSIIATGAVDILIHDVKSEAEFGAYFDSGVTAKITDSILISSDDDALEVGDATVIVERSVIDGSDSSADGVIYGDGSPDVTVRYSYVRPDAVVDPWPGTLVCTYISGQSGEVSGCPAVSAGPVQPGSYRNKPIHR